MAAVARHLAVRANSSRDISSSATVRLASHLFLCRSTHRTTQHSTTETGLRLDWDWTFRPRRTNLQHAAETGLGISGPCVTFALYALREGAKQLPQPGQPRELSRCTLAA